MKLLRFTLVWAILCLHAPIWAQSAEIADELLQIIQNDVQEQQPVYLFLADQVDVPLLERSFDQRAYSIQQRVPFLLDALQQKAASTQPALIDKLRNIDGVDADQIRTYWIANTLFLEATPKAILAISNFPEVAEIGINTEIYPHRDIEVVDASPALVPEGVEPGLRAINAPFMWQLGYTGYGRVAMIIDTGEDPDHPAIQTQFRGNTHPMDEAWLGENGPGYCISNDFGAASHGTHVTGTVMGLDRLRNDTIGVAFNSQWIAGGVELRGCDDFTSGRVESIVSNFQWSLNPDNNPSTTSDMPDVINNSWGSDFPGTRGCAGSFSFPSSLINALYAAGIAPVFSAGNEGSGSESIGSPAHIALDTVRSFSVGATITTAPFTIGGFSSRGPTTCTVAQGPLKIKPEVSAPGVQVRSSVIGGGYQSWNGTSMSAPHVSGAIVLLKEAFPSLSGEDIMLALYNSARDLGAPGEDNTYGKGLIDLEAAYNHLIAKGNTPVPPVSDELDVTLIRVNNNDIFCDNTYYPEIIVENAGRQAITSFELKMDFRRGGTSFSVTRSWEGVILSGEETYVYFTDGISLSTGNWDVNYTLINPNQTEDDRPLNNQLYNTITVSNESGLALQELQSPICKGESAILTFENELESNKTIWWYGSQIGESVLFKGRKFRTPALEENTVYYGSSVIEDRLGREKSQASFFETEFSNVSGTQFAVSRSLELISVDVFAENSGTAGISLRSQSGGIIDVTNISVEEGWNTLELNFIIPALSDLILTQLYGPQLLIESKAGGYPYAIDQAITLFAPYSTVNADDYGVFYDWKVRYSEICDRTPIMVEVADEEGQAISIEAIVTDADVSFDADISGFEFYNWDFGDGNSAQGQNVTHTYTEKGDYIVYLTVQTTSGCLITTETIVTIDKIVSTSRLDNPGGLELAVSPNPMSSFLNINIRHDRSEEALLKVSDLLGKQISAQTIDLQAGENQLVYPTSHWPAGVYLLSVRTDDGQRVLRVVRQ